MHDGRRGGAVCGMAKDILRMASNPNLLFHVDSKKYFCRAGRRGQQLRRGHLEPGAEPLRAPNSRFLPRPSRQLRAPFASGVVICTNKVQLPLPLVSIFPVHYSKPPEIPPFAFFSNSCFRHDWPGCRICRKLRLRLALSSPRRSRYRSSRLVLSAWPVGSVVH